MRQDVSLGHTVVVGVDGSKDSRHALEWATDTAAQRHLSLRVVHAVDFPHSQVGIAVGFDAAAGRSSPQRIVDEAVTAVRSRLPELAVTGNWRVGTPWAVLASEASAADLLVVGSRGYGSLASILIGSVSAEVAQFARCPVVVVRESARRHDPAKPTGVVVGVDGTAASIHAVEFAFAEASRRGLPLTVVHAVWDPMVESQAVVSLLSRRERVAVDDAEMLGVAETIAGWREIYPDVGVVTLYENGRPARVLADLSDGAALLVVGSRGRGAAAALLGSVSRSVLKYARCPVAVVRGDKRARSSHQAAVAAGE